MRRAATMTWLGPACLIFALGAFGAQASTPRQVLILQSFGRDFEPYNSVAPAFRIELVRLAPERIVFHEAALDAARPPTPEDEGSFVHFLQARYGESPPELVAAIGLPAARFYLRHRRDLFRMRYCFTSARISASR